MLFKGAGNRECMRALYSKGCLGIFLALFAGAITTEAHICIPGIFWQAPSVAAATNNNQPNDLPLPESLTTDSAPPDVPSTLISPVADRSLGATEQNPAGALNGLSSATSPAIASV